jgi:anaerobic selenocysteine-containing dehydrogenase
MTEIKTHFRACNLCEATCGIVIQTRGKEILSIKGDPDDPFSRGHICPKAVALKDLYEDPDRVKKPIRRSEKGWKEISWKQAFEEVEKGLKAVQKKYGNDAVATYQGNPNVHNLGLMMLGGAFVRQLKTKNRFTATSADQLPHHLASAVMFGHPLLVPIPDIDRTNYMLILGGNPLVSNGSMMTVPDVKNRLRAIQQRGGKIVVIDPRKTRSAEMADAHHFIKPGTDVFFLLAMLYILVEEGKGAMGHLAEISEGVEEVKTWIKDFSPEKVADVTGISAARIRAVTEDFIQAEKAVCYGRMGVSTQAFGGMCQYIINLINIFSGNLDREGGAMFTAPAVDLVGTRATRGRPLRFGRWKTRIRQLPEFSGELPVAALAEEISTPGEGQLKALVSIAGNPVLSTPNGKALDQALEQLEFMVAIDFYLNETTRHAHIILPPVTNLEADHYDLIFNMLAVRNVSKFSPFVFEKEEDEKQDWEILLELSIRMATKNAMERAFARKQQSKVAKGGPRYLLNEQLEAGPYDLSVEKLLANPHGIDLGELTSCLPERLYTTSGKIELGHEIYEKDIARIKAAFERLNTNTSSEQLALIGRRNLRTNNSWMHNSERLVKGNNRCTLLMHPSDAEKRKLQDKDQVTVSSRVGKVELPLEITEDIMPGVVSIPHGWGHHQHGSQLKVAHQHPGVSINDLTDHESIDQLSGNAAFNGQLILVAKS